MVILFFILLLCCLFIFVSPIHAQIIISEVYPNPLSGESEWIEIANFGTQSADLSDWILQDQLSSSKDIYQFDNLVLFAGDFFVASVSGQLNNSSDGVTLLNSSSEVIAQMNYSNSTPGLSWSYFEDQYFLLEPTYLASSFIDKVPSPSPTSTDQEAAVLPTPLVKNEDFYGKLSLLRVMSCPENSAEWFELKNIADHTLEGELKVIDEQNNIFNFSVNLLSGQQYRYYLDRHILNNSGDIFTLAQDQDNILFSFLVPECKEKNKEFRLINGQLSLLENEDTTSNSSVLGSVTSLEITEKLPVNKINSGSFRIDQAYLTRLQLTADDEVGQNFELDFNDREATVYTEDDEFPIMTISLIFTGIILSFLGIMYFYGKEKPQDIDLD